MSEKKSYFQQLKVINKIYKPNTAAYLMLLLDKHKYWASHTDNFYRQTGRRFTGHFYISRSTFDKEINLKRTAQKTAEEILKKDRIIEMTPLDGKANWYTINYEMLQEKIDHYYWEQEETEDEVSDYPFDDSEEYEEWIFGNEPDQAPYDPQTEHAHPSMSGGAPRSDQGATNNKELKINNKNKVSKETYVPDGTESIYSALDQDIKCSKHKNTRIKEKESATKPPGAWAPSGKGDKIQDIVNEYNTAMGLPQKKGDYEAVQKHLKDFEAIRKYLTPSALEYAWRNFSDEKAKNLKTKRLSALEPYGVLKPFVERKNEIYSYISYKWDDSLNKIFRQFKPEIEPILEKDHFNVNFVGEINNENGEDLTPKECRKKRIEIYKQHLEPKLLQDEELHDMIIDMEVPSWII